MLPKVANLVWVHFPHLPGVPGPYPRPALVTAVSREHHAVKVVFGTSQKTDRLYLTEFVVRKSDTDFLQAGLSWDTKFDVSREIKLPFNRQWFDIAPTREGQPKSTSPVMGTLPASYMPALRLALANVQ
ncbi:hypothetical protein [Candidatus Pantoea multigeneris]|uniref:hypothetical protein n=1 Tax=Candidatus Pantoea multigeneris TaxID=2608357 RepID=UPI001F038C8E|nr:hypothetical protein [Pantoea multigeneris]